MKHLLFAIGAGLLLSACAIVRVRDTQTAAVVTKRPSAIYIKPFAIEGSSFVGDHEGGRGERPIRESLAPAQFANDLKEELELLAPTRVLLPDEIAEHGWLVQGALEVVDAGSRLHRSLVPVGDRYGQSHILIHVRVIDLDSKYEDVEAKSEGTLRQHGHIIYEFDVAGGSRGSGKAGTVTAPGLGHASNFDYRNAAERIRTALEIDPHRYGARSSTTLP
jgi:hypothetical protein